MTSERDREIIYKMKHQLTPEQVKEKYCHLMNQIPQIFEVTDVSDDDELTDEEIDNLLDGQEDDTLDETEECYINDYKPVNYSDKYDVILPDGFETWSNFAKTAWLKKQGCI